MEYPEYFDYPAYQDQAEDPGEPIGQQSQQQSQQQQFSRAVNAHMPDPSRGPLYHPVVAPMSCDVKPRLTKEQHDLLEAHFQKQHKPSTTTKRGFADTLSVPLDKINNWFQNRRAKAKQDAKKAAGQAALYGTHTQTFGSDSEPSPFQASQQYAMMQHHLRSDEDLASGLGISQMPQPQPHPNGGPFSSDLAAQAQLQSFGFDGGLSAQEMYPNAFDMNEMNRRTITQEQFNEMSRHGGMVNGSGQFESFDMAFSGDHGALGQVFSDFVPKQDGIPLGYPQVAPPLSSNDSTVPSVVSEHSIHAFPSADIMQHHASISAPGSDWADSRSSSLASSQHGAMGAPLLPVQSQPQSSTSQWEPGQSIPVNVDAMKDEFQHIAAQANIRASMDQGQDQPLAYPSDDAYVRRGSTASLLAQSMGDIGLHTSQLEQSNGQFQRPLPSATSNIATRRQRRAPANLGIAAMRSQSFGGPGQPSSPGYQHNLAQGQPIRRTISSNVLNGVAQGRVMKSVPGSAQRSPLNWNFNDAVNAPHLMRAVSQGNLAPITPVTPVHPNQAQQAPNLPVASGQMLRQPSISENEEQGFMGASQYLPPSSLPQHVSPPHTPHWYQQPFVPQRVGSNFIVENTPPQSAPASQTAFPSNVFGPPPPPNPHMAAIANAQQQQYLNLAVPEQQFQMSNVTFAPSQHATVVASGPAPGAPLTFATGVPVMTANGNVQMSFPAQMQMMQPSQSPSQAPYAFVNSNGASAGTMSAGQPPKLATQPANDFVVHEYSPPNSIKRSVSPRKVVDSGPRSYSFAHTGPVDFEEKRVKKDASSSPISSDGTAATS